MALKITPRAMWRSLVQRFGNPGHAAESPGGAGDAGFWNAWWDQRLAADLVSSDAHFGVVEGLAWMPFSPKDEDSVRERDRQYHAAREE